MGLVIRPDETGSRREQLSGDRVLVVVGRDEYGMPVRQWMPVEFADEWDDRQWRPVHPDW